MNVAQSVRLNKEKAPYSSSERYHLEHAVTDTVCACGCGGFTGRGRGKEPNVYIHGHATRGRKFPRTQEQLDSLHSGGRVTKQSGYVTRLVRGHPRGDNGYVAEHILIAEAALGRPLPKKHPVHHVNESRADNRNCNLVICEDTAYHFLLHRRMRALRACGDPAARPCGFCHKHDLTEHMVNQGGSHGYAHQGCLTAYQRNYNRGRKQGVGAAT